MSKKYSSRVRNILIPCCFFSILTGIFTGAIIFLFRICAEHVIHSSGSIFGFVRENPAFLPLLVLGAAALGAISYLMLKLFPNSRGGDAQTTITSLRGFIPLKWLSNTVVVFFSSLLTYFSGVPLGEEGTSVQMGAAMGKGATGLVGKRNRAWERSNMTCGACSGFAIATGAPLAGVIFAMEEAHRRFSPTIFIVAATSVISGTVTSEFLSGIFNVDTTFFDLKINEILPFRHLWIAVLIGVVCGISANLLTKVYHYVRKIGKRSSFKIPFIYNILIIFFAVSVLGFISADFIGSGHSLIERILEGHSVWYVILAAFVIRSLVMIFATNGGISGGLFVPTLAFGAMISSLVADALIALGVVDAQYYAIFIVIGMASFLSSSSRIPLTALAFSVEALCIANNILPVILGVVAAYIVAEITGKESFADTVIEVKTADAHAGKTPIIVDTHMVVQPRAFAIGMEIRDVLWPPTCTILSVDKEIVKSHHTGYIEEGDLLHLHYLTYNSEETLGLLSQIIGEQSDDRKEELHESNEACIVPQE